METLMENITILLEPVDGQLRVTLVSGATARQSFAPMDTDEMPDELVEEFVEVLELAVARVHTLLEAENAVSEARKAETDS